MRKNLIQSIIGMAIGSLLLLTACGKTSMEQGGENVESTITVAATMTSELAATSESTITSSGDITLDEEHFPDEVFRSFLASYVDTNSDGILSLEERGELIAIDDVDGCFSEGRDLSAEEKKEIRQMIKTIHSFEGLQQMEAVKQIILQNENNVEALPLSNSKLERIILKNIPVDMGELLKLETLKEIDLLNCDIIWSEQKSDFSSLQVLEYFSIEMSDVSEEPLQDILDFGKNELLRYVHVSGGMVRQVILPSMKTDAVSEVDSEKSRCKFIFMDEISAELPADLPEGAVLLDEEHFPDELFRQYLYLYVDANQDRVLSMEEREAVTRIRNDNADYDKDAFWNEGNADTIDTDLEEMFFYASHISNLQGIEYFPNLYEIQLQKLQLIPEMTELVITNPNLEILELTFDGNVKDIYLTSCEKLRVCIVDDWKEAEIAVHLPKHLKWETIAGYDCVIGETARTWFAGNFWPRQKLPDVLIETEKPMDVVLDATVFPDLDFRNFLALYIDKDNNGILEQQERNQLQELVYIGPLLTDWELYSVEQKEDMYNRIKAIRSFEGIEYFNRLTNVELKSESKVEVLPLNNPNLEHVEVSTETIREFTLQNAVNLKRLLILSHQNRPEEFCGKINWNGICNLETLDVKYVNVDMDAVVQNERLREISVGYCNITWKQKEVDFAALTELTSFRLVAPEYITEHWEKVLDFGENEENIYVQITKGVVGQLCLPSMESEFSYLGSEDAEEYCQILFSNEIGNVNTEQVQDGCIPLDVSHFPDGGFRYYLYRWVDQDYDKMLSKEEREALVSIRNYRKAEEDDETDVFYGYLLAEKIGDLQGIEYFPNLQEICLKDMCLSMEKKALVISNPNLETLYLTLYGMLECIDLSGCEKLRECALRSEMETKPEILLPNHLELETVEGWDCVIGETAQEMCSGE